MSQISHDLRLAWRALAKSPGFTAVAVITLALGIGANTAIFSVVDGVLLRRLPYAEPDRLVALWGTRGGNERGSFSPADMLDIARDSRSLTGIVGFSDDNLNLTGDGEPERLDSATVSAGFFDTLGARPGIGRLFDAGVEPPPERTVVLSHAFWQRRFAGDPGVLGETLTLDGEGHTVIGVLPAGFRFPPLADAEVWTRGPEGVPAPPIPLPPESSLRDERNFHYFSGIARLAPGASLGSARTELDAIAQRLANDFPDSNDKRGATAVPLAEDLTAELRPALLVLLGAVGLVLLIACTNVANLMLARTVGRSREMAVRAALGAGRLRLLRELLAEGLLLALAGGALGLLVGSWGLESLLALVPPQLADLGATRLDGRVLLFTAGVALISVLLFSLLPALRASRPDLQEPLRSGGRGATAGGARLRAVLVSGETALALVLLTGAGLLLRSLLLITAVEPGFDPANVLTLTVSLPAEDYREDAAMTSFYDRALDNLAALPGVERASQVFTLPFGGSGAVLRFDIDGREEPPDDRFACGFQVVGPGYFETLRIPLLAGRTLEPADGPDAPGVTVINRAMAAKFFPDVDPVGERLSFGDPEEDGWLTVVGVVGDVRHNGFDYEPRAEAYLSHRQAPWNFATFVLRTAGDPMALADAARSAIQAADPDLPVYRVQPFTRLLEDSLAERRFLALLVGIFAGVAAALAALGIYGVIAYSVSRRSREIGIRMALGAGRGAVVRAVVGGGLRLTAAGVAAGALAALGLTRLLSGMLYGIGAADPLSFAVAALLIAAVATLASLLPARRAARVEPVVALRDD